MLSRWHGCVLAALICLAAAPAAAQDKARLSLGAKAFDASCKSCHDTGRPQNDAPQLSEKGAWAERYKKGLAELYKNAIEGFSGDYPMPARGDDPTLTDEQTQAAVDYMLRRAGVR